MKKQQILVVDDYPPILMSIKIVLERKGYTIFTATDGEQALQVMEEKARPDLILSDIMMPQMDGYTLYKAVRARPEWASIPFVFMTAKMGQECKSRAKNLGVDDYIVKPFAFQELMAVIRAWLERTKRP